MYVVIISALLAAAAGLFLLGTQQRRFCVSGIGVALAIFTGFLLWFMGFWSEALWFEAVAYRQRFWTVVLSKAAIALVGAGLAAGLVHLLTWSIATTRRFVRIGSKFVAAYVGGHWGLANWDTILLYLKPVETGTADPILNRDTGFYLLSLPVYEATCTLLLFVALLALASWGVTALVRVSGQGLCFRIDGALDANRERSHGSLYGSVGALLVALAGGTYLDRFHLIYSTLGVVAGPGRTDVYVRLPAFATTIVLLLLLAVLLMVWPACRAAQGFAQHYAPSPRIRRVSPPILSVVVVVAAGFVLLLGAPGLLQWLRVQPNEITVELPYLLNNIEFTRRGFKPNDIEEREFTVSEQFSKQMLQDSEGTFDNVRLRGGNYIRNSAKTVVDTYDESVDFYVCQSNDPLIQVWQNVFPDAFKNRSEMPDALRQHMRPGNYGRLLADKVAKEKRVLGTQQMETRIDRDSCLSGQLSLWDQRGSRVIRGNVLAISVEDMLIDTEPIYLQAETAAYPELRLVTIMHDDNLSYAPRFYEALEALFGEAPPQCVRPQGACCSVARAIGPAGRQRASAPPGHAPAALGGGAVAAGRRQQRAAGE